MSNKNPALLEIGGVFNERYEIRRCIKAGGMGAVYEVLHLQTNRPRALKVMLPSVVSNEDLRGRFKLEATVISAVESDHIAEVLDAGVDDATGSPFILMELLKGEELGAMAARMGHMPPEDVALYLQHAAYGLEKTHEAGIVHRDLKPENLFVTYRDDGTPRVKLLDFGIAKVLGDTKTQQTRGILGTPLYISPEQVHGEQLVSGRTDVYALGHIAYTLLVGEPYWAAEEHSAESIMPLLVTIMRGHSEKATARAKKRKGIDLPPEFDDWFDKAAAARPEDRFAGPLVLVEAFTEVFGIEIGAATSVVRKSVTPEDVFATSSPTVSATAALPEAVVEEAPPSPATPRPATVAARSATVAAKPEDLAVAQEASIGASTAAEMSRSVIEPTKSRPVWPWMAVAGAVLLGGAYYELSDDETSGEALPASAATTGGPENTATAQDSAAPENTGAPQNTAVAAPPPVAEPEPSTEASAAPSAVVVAPRPGPRVAPVPRPPSPTEPKPASSGWQPIVPDR